MDVRSLKERAGRLTAEGRFERAEVLYRQLLTRHPRDAGLWLRHAEVLRHLERTADALASYRMAARLLEAAGHSARAVACLKVALELQPDDVDLVTDIIRYELRQRQHERTRASFPAPLPPPPDAGPPSQEPEPKLLALPMLVSSPSRVAALVPETQEPLPVPRASAPRIPLEVEAPIQRWPQVRRLSDGELAIKPSPFSKWIVITSSSDLEVRFFDEYPVSEEALWLEEPSE
ncbi:MAG: tetratricopeptide repeat protein [Myxococcota bacterium]